MASQTVQGAVVLLLSLCAGVAPGASLCDPASGWTVAWVDEFEGSALDNASWTVEVGPGGSRGRDAYLTADNVIVTNGTLILRSLREKGPKYNFTSGAVDSKAKKSFSNARICVRAKLPGFSKEEGSGIWPAHWLMPDDDSCWPDHGEIDIMEMVNGDGVSHGTYHWSKEYPTKKCLGPAGNTAKSGETTAAYDWANEYHEYSTEWDSEQGYVAFFVDGKLINNATDASSYPPSPMYVILNTAVGGPWPHPVTAATKFPAYHTIDSVKVLTRTGIQVQDTLPPLA